MPQSRNKFDWHPAILLILLLALIAAGFLYYKGAFQTDSALQSNVSENQKTDSEEQKDGNVYEKSILLKDGTLKARVELPELEYENLDKDESLKTLMTERKEELGLKDSLDMIVHADETISIGGVPVSVNDILEKSFAKKGLVFERNIEKGIKEGKNRSETSASGRGKAYGIYVVKRSDNIWAIHFDMLREYYESKGIIISPNADQPTKQGTSSGIGKILKFSEKVVVVYNLSDRKLANNINLLKPKSKVIVYNMNEIFALLNDIDFGSIDRLQFDGETLWIPTEEN